MKNPKERSSISLFIPLLTRIHEARERFGAESLPHFFEAILRGAEEDPEWLKRYVQATPAAQRGRPKAKKDEGGEAR